MLMNELPTRAECVSSSEIIYNMFSNFSSPQTLFQQLRRAQTRTPEDQQAQHWRLPLYPQPRFPSLQSGYKQKLIVYSTQQIRYAIAICISHIKET